MRFPVCLKLFPAIVFSCLIFIFFGNVNHAFASYEKEPVWVAGTTLSLPGTPYIISGSNTYSPTWSWEASQTRIAGTVHYLVWWCQLPDFSGCQNNRMYSDSNTFSFEGANQMQNGIWYLKVQAMDEFGNKSPFSKIGAGSINNYIISAPVNLSAKLEGNTVSLGWNDCGGLTFKVWRSTNGENGNFEVISETSDYTLMTNLGSEGVAWYYLTAADEWGNESEPSGKIEVARLTLQEQRWSLKDDLFSIFKPVFEANKPFVGQVAGANTSIFEDNTLGSPEPVVYTVANFIPLGYFKAN